MRTNNVPGKSAHEKSPRMRALKEATTRFELVITVLQTDALPLGYVAI